MIPAGVGHQVRCDQASGRLQVNRLTPRSNATDDDRMIVGGIIPAGSIRVSMTGACRVECAKPVFDGAPRGREGAATSAGAGRFPPDT